MKYKPSKNLQQLLILIYCWKNFFINFVIWLPSFADWKDKSYDSILVIIYWLTKIVYYKLVLIVITIPTLVKVIFNIVVWYYDLFNFIISTYGLIFISKFLFYYTTPWVLSGNFISSFTLRPTTKLSSKIV